MPTVQQVGGAFVDYTIHRSNDFVWALSWLKGGQVKMRRKWWEPKRYIARNDDTCTTIMEVSNLNPNRTCWNQTIEDLFAEDWEVYEDAS